MEKEDSVVDVAGPMDSLCRDIAVPKSSLVDLNGFSGRSLELVPLHSRIGGQW